MTAKRTYKKYERKLKRDYLRYQGDHVEYLKKKNPKKKNHTISFVNVKRTHKDQLFLTSPTTLKNCLPQIATLTPIKILTKRLIETNFKEDNMTTIPLTRDIQ